jgi:hypothetical protein
MNNRNSILYKLIKNTFIIGTLVVMTVCADRKLVSSSTLVSEVKIKEPFSTEASDLFGIPQDSQADIERRIEFMKNIRYSSNVEVGDRSCYVNMKAGSGTARSGTASVEISVYASGVPTFVFTLATPMHERQTVTLESEETVLSDHRKNCYSLINLARKYDILLSNLYMHKPKQPSNLELNTEDYWNPLTRKD